MSKHTHAAMCVYCGESIIYDTREVTDMAAAHAKIVEHDQQCSKNPLVGRIAFLNQQNTALQEQCDEYRDHLAVISEMTGNKGDIGAAHEGVNAVIEECATRLKRIEFLNQQNTTLQEQNDALAAHLEQIKPEAVSLVGDVLGAFDADSRCDEEDKASCEENAFDSATRMKLLLSSSPTTSLARRDSHPDCELECGAYGTYCKCAAEGHQ